MSDFVIHPATVLGAANLVVADATRASRFYTTVLRFQLLQHQGDLVLGAEDATPLLLLSERVGVRPKPWRTAGLYHVAICLPNRADLARALQHLIEIRWPLQGVADHLVSESIYLADPDGNGLEICADRPRSGWLRRNGQVQMSTGPLDMDGLLAELRDGRRWEGVPAGTRVSHVHLQVSDLGQAEEFYHRLLGLNLTLHYSGGALFFAAGDYHHHVGTNIWAGRGAPPAPPDTAGLRYLTLMLPNQEELARLAERVQRSGGPWEEQEQGLFLRDPSGNGVLLAASPGAA